jgi:membrane fusion protein (multidrug efflux system)
VPLKVNFSVSERYFDAVRQGTKVSFTVEGFLDAFDAEIYAVSSEVNLATRMLDVKALYSNADGQLMPGRYAAVRITLYELDNAIVVPSEAVIKEMGIDKVYVSRGNLAQPVTVITGQRTEALVEVLKGLVPGDTLLTTGTLQLRQGLPVKLENL